MIKENEPISPELGRIVYVNVRLDSMLEGNLHLQDEAAVAEQLEFIGACIGMEKRNIIRIPDRDQLNRILKTLQATLSDFRKVEARTQQFSLEVQLAIDTA